MIDKALQKRIWDAVDNIDKDIICLPAVSPVKHIKMDVAGKLMKDANDKYITYHKFRGTYQERYRLIKSLGLGHRPTKEETDEVM